MNKKCQEIEMKKQIIPKICAVATLCAVAFSPTPGRGTLSVCLTFENCSNRATASMPCCCRTGETGGGITTYRCPTGWLNVSGTCKRNPTTGSDAKGSYTQNYGTCSPTATTTDTYDCYRSAPVGSTDYQGGSCYCKLF